jgi:hypothetical protein
MDRQATLLSLAQKMSAATDAADWPALAALNTLLTTALPAMAAQGKWTPSERAALAALRELHQAAVLKVDSATVALGRQLYDMINNKEGWLAYALTSEAAATGTDA